MKVDLSVFMCTLQASSHDRKASLVLEELRQRWTQPKDNGQLEGKLVAMETKCEQLEEKLADAK